MLKKLLILTAIFVGLASLCYSQTTVKGLVGMNFSNLSENPEGTEVTGNAGFQIGGGIRFGNKFYVEPGFQYVSISRDFKVKADNSDDVTFNTTENWFKVPVYAGFYILGEPDDDIGLRVFLGPTISFLGSLKSDEGDLLDKDDIESPRYSLDGGVGVDILFLFAEVNYEYGLNEHSSLDGFDASHGAFIFNIGVQFQL